MDAKNNQCELVSSVSPNSGVIERELTWLEAVIDARLTSYFDKKQVEQPAFENRQTQLPELPLIGADQCSFTRFLEQHNFCVAERLLFILAMTPYIRPQLLDVLLTKNEATGRGFTEFGGVAGLCHGGVIPTVETALFLYAGDKLEPRFELLKLLNGCSSLIQESVLHVETVAQHEPWSSGALSISREHLDELTHEYEHQPGYSSDFPAQKITTSLSWEDLVLPTVVLEQLSEIRDWVNHGQTLLTDWEMKDRLSPGYTALFYGFPGTGKTLSASLLGKCCNCEVYRIDLSMMVSKYIGETEKNLARVFDAAENRKWILFFDEADALFGKRTKIESSHDRHANQEVSFLLQRIESFNGVVALASNIKFNIDDSFTRRFQSVIEFPMPNLNERLRLWQQSFSRHAVLEQTVDLYQLSSDHNLSGGMILNVVRFASLRALARNSSEILLQDIQSGIRREYLKEGREI